MKDNPSVGGLCREDPDGYGMRDLPGSRIEVGTGIPGWWDQDVAPIGYHEGLWKP